MVFEEAHDDRRGDIVGQVRHDFQRLPAVLFLRQLRQVHFHDVFVDDLNVVPAGQGVLKDGDERTVDLHGDDFLRRAGQVLGHGADARPDLQDAVILRDLRRFDDLLQHAGIDEEVLAEFLLKCEIIFLQDRDGLLRIAKGRFFH